MKLKYIPKQNSIREFICNDPSSLDYRCLECGVYMGRLNPRQLCAKYFCDNQTHYFGDLGDYVVNMLPDSSIHYKHPRRK